MGVDVTIKNKQLFKKPLTIDELTMGKYGCGTVDQYGRNTCKPGNGDIVFYDKNRIGRGVIIYSWSDSVKDSVDLRLNSFSTFRDIDMFYEFIRNIMKIWKAKDFEQDGSKYTANDIDRLADEQKEFSIKYMSEIESIVNDSNGHITIPSAMFDIDIAVERLKEFGNSKDADGYADYLHGLQSIDAYYAVPSMYESKDKKNVFFGNYVITTDTDTIFPLKASVPMMFKNPNTGKALECDDFRVTFFDYDKKKPIGSLSFDDFAQKAGIANYPKLDETHIFLKGMTAGEMEELLK